MDLLWMILPVLLVCAGAKNLTEVKVELGQNVILNCSLNATDIYWYLEIHRQLKGCIVRTYSTSSSSNLFYVTPFITKYTAVNNSLVVTNITAEDCRLYFCARKQSKSIVFEDSFRLVAVFPDDRTTPCTTDSERNRQQQPVWSISERELVVYSSFALNVLLLLVVIGLVFTSLCLKTRKCNYQENDPSPLTCENPETLDTQQYEEIQLPTYRAPRPAGPPLECIYSEAQLPRATLP